MPRNDRLKKKICVHPRPSAVFSCFILAALLILALPASANNPRNTRRTLFVPVGQLTLTFESPTDMCFLDTTAPFESALYKAFQSVVQKKNDQVLLAVFADCRSIASLTEKSGTRNIPLNAGTIAWMNPSIGDKTPLTREEYLDMRSPSLQPYLENSPLFLPGFFADKEPHRTESSVSLGLDGTIDIDGEKTKTAVVLGTTTLRHIPIEVTIRYTEKEPPALKKMYRLMDTFMAQQVALNE